MNHEIGLPDAKDNIEGDKSECRWYILNYTLSQIENFTLKTSYESIFHHEIMFIP